MPAINQGEVSITLDGNEAVLKSTLKAAKQINAVFGSFTDALRRVGELDFGAYIAVVAAGLDKTPRDVEEAVFATGMPDLGAPLSQYLALLANGGRPADSNKKDTNSGNG